MPQSERRGTGYYTEPELNPSGNANFFYPLYVLVEEITELLFSARTIIVSVQKALVPFVRALRWWYAECEPNFSSLWKPQNFKKGANREFFGSESKKKIFRPKNL